MDRVQLVFTKRAAVLVAPNIWNDRQFQVKYPNEVTPSPVFSGRWKMDFFAFFLHHQYIFFYIISHCMTLLK